MLDSNLLRVWMPCGVHVILYTQRCNIRSVKADLIIRLTPASAVVSDLSFRHFSRKQKCHIVNCYTSF